MYFYLSSIVVSMLSGNLNFHSYMEPAIMYLFYYRSLHNTFMFKIIFWKPTLHTIRDTSLNLTFKFMISLQQWASTTVASLICCTLVYYSIPFASHVNDPRVATKHQNVPFNLNKNISTQLSRLLLMEF